VRGLASDAEGLTVVLPGATALALVDHGVDKYLLGERDEPRGGLNVFAGMGVVVRSGRHLPSGPVGQLPSGLGQRETGPGLGREDGR
jgi:hypothetical protein